MDVDFDFFDSPRDGGTAGESAGKGGSESRGRSPSPPPKHKQHAHAGGRTRHDSPESPRRDKSGSRSSKDHTHTVTVSAGGPRAREDEIIAKVEESNKHSHKKTEARIEMPDTGYVDVDEDSCSDHDSYSESFDEDTGSDSDTQSESDKSGRRAPTPKSARKGRRQSNPSSHGTSQNQAWGEGTEVAEKDPRLSSGRRKRNGRRSRSNSASRRRNSNGSGRSASADASTSDWSSDTDSDVTDVSPLHSPSRQHGSSSKPPKSPMYKDKRPISAKSVGSSSAGNASSRLDQLLQGDKDTVDLKLLMDAVLEMEQEQQYARKPRKQFIVPPPAGPGKQSRKNMSFRNDKVRDIDRENQRLMQNIVRYAVEAKQAKMRARQKVKTQAPAQTQQRLTPSAVNRLREQRRIEAENRAMLRRLQTTKASRTIQRDEQLKSYNNHMLFGQSVAGAHYSAKKQARSPYEGSSSSAMGMHSSSTSSLQSSGSSRPRRPHSSAVIMATPGSGSRPTSATVTKPKRPTSATVHKPRPTSATNPQTQVSMTAGDQSDSKKTRTVEWETGW